VEKLESIENFIKRLSGYNAESLKEIYNSIDRDAFPERFIALKAEIKSRGVSFEEDLEKIKKAEILRSRNSPNLLGVSIGALKLYMLIGLAIIFVVIKFVNVFFK
jgi:hypothetical protein